MFSKEILQLYSNLIWCGTRFNVKQKLGDHILADEVIGLIHAVEIHVLLDS
jgi:hypothetical protein